MRSCHARCHNHREKRVCPCISSSLSSLPASRIIVALFAVVYWVRPRRSRGMQRAGHTQASTAAPRSTATSAALPPTPAARPAPEVPLIVLLPDRVAGAALIEPAGTDESWTEVEDAAAATRTEADDADVVAAATTGTVEDDAATTPPAPAAEVAAVVLDPPPVEMSVPTPAS